MFTTIKKTERNSLKRNFMLRKVVNIVVIAAMAATMIIPTALLSNAAGVKITASAYSKNKAVVRKTASIHGKKLAVLKNNTKLVLYKEIFTAKANTKAAYRWYYAKAGNIRGFIRSDQIKSIKYNTKKCRTTDNLYYRVGVGKTMKRKGMFKKGATVEVALDAYFRGSKEKWHKVKVGKNYYYSSASWITTAPAKKTTTTNTSKTTSAAPNGKASLNSDVNSSDKVSNSVTGATIPTNLGVGCPFSIRGTVKSNKVIDSVAVAIVKPDGTNASCVRKKVGKNTFDISTLDSEVKFGVLSAGKYKYLVKIHIGSGGYPVIYNSFTVVKSRKAQVITNKAFELAWPVGTSDKKMDYGPGSATSAFKTAIAQVYPNRSRWGSAAKAGASCDVFVGTVLRASGMDTQAPRGLDEQYKYYPKSKKWKRISYNGNRSVLKSGDVIILDKGKSSHTFLYLTKNSKEYIAEAGYKQFYGRLASGSYVSYALQKKSGRTFYVYRIVD